MFNTNDTKKKTGITKKPEPTNNEINQMRTVLRTVAKYSPAEKLHYLQTTNFIYSKKYCGWYAQLLKTYINDVKTDYVPFIRTFHRADIEDMLKFLHVDQCPRNTYTTVLDWLTQALRAEALQQKGIDDHSHSMYEKFAVSPSSVKLNYLKSNMKFMTSKQYCGWYAHLLDSYITGAKTDYAPFIKTFDKTEIERMLNSLHPNQCSENTYTAVLVWLTQALNAVHQNEKVGQDLRTSQMQTLFKKVATYTPAEKLHHLKFMHFSDSKIYCGMYAQLLDSYISDVKTDYAPFIKTFDTTEIKNMLNSLHPNHCPKNTYTTVLTWLTQALHASQQKGSPQIKQMRTIFKDIAKYTPAEKLHHLKFMHFDNSEIYCGMYAQLLNSYIADVKTDYAPFIKTFDTVEIENMLNSLHPNHCSENTYTTVLTWLTQALHASQKL